MLPTPLNEPRELADRELHALLACSAEPVVVESHYAGWEKPWRALTAADWHEFQREFGERVNGARVETGANREAALRHGLEILPTVLVFVDGAIVARLTGRVRVATLVATVRTALEQQRGRETAMAELEATSAARERPSTVRSILRHRASEETPAFARVG